MSRPTTLTLTAPNGVKVRTARSRRLFVVEFGTLGSGQPFARVVKRTDDATTARREANRGRRVVFDATGARAHLDGAPRVLSGEMLVARSVLAPAVEAEVAAAAAALGGGNRPAMLPNGNLSHAGCAHDVAGRYRCRTEYRRAQRA